MARHVRGVISADSIKERIRQIRDELADMELAQEQLTLRLSVYRELLSEVQAENGSQPPTRATRGKKRKISDAVMAAVTASPGIRPAAVVNQVMPNIKTKAKNPRKNVFQTVLNLINAGRLEKDADGGLKVVDGTAAAR